MTALVLPLGEIRRSDEARVGGKAANLGALHAEGFPVPAAVCVTVEAFDLALAAYADRIATILRGHDVREPARAVRAAEAISVALADLTVPEPVLQALHDALPAVAGDGGAVAVRSSATDEDAAERSLAGQYETVLGVRGEAAVGTALIRCWRSCFSAHALAARAAMSDRRPAMAVLIQRMVDAECAGLCFTRDPVRPEGDSIVVEAAWGLGVGAVDGNVATDLYRLPRGEHNRIEERRIVEKRERIGLDPDGGVRREPVPDDRQPAACLPDPWLHRVVEFGLASELLLDRPQDVEWAIAGGQFWLLQSRPITTLTPEQAGTWNLPENWRSETDGRFWTLFNIDREDVPSPLEADVSITFAKAMADALPMSAWPGASDVRLFNGRRYGSFVPSPLSPADQRVRNRAKVDLTNRLREEGKTVWDHYAPEIKSAIARLHAFDAPDDDAKVAEHLEDAFGTFRRHWMVHWLPWTGDDEAQPLWRAFTAMTGLTGQERERALAPLLDGEETVLTRLIDDLYALAQSAAGVPVLVALLKDQPTDAWQQIERLPEAADFRTQMAAFLEQYGEHMGMGYGSDTPFARPTWRQDPGQVLALLAPYAQPGIEAPAAARVRARVERERRVEAVCAACDDPAKVAEFRRWLPTGRKEATMLEAHNYYIDQVSYGQLRTAVGLAAKRLLARGSIAEGDDVFWLRVEEIAGVLRAEDAEASRHLVAERKAAAAAQRTQMLPPLLGIPRAQLDPRPPLKDEVTSDTPADPRTLKGVGASAGKAHGRARIVAPTVAVPSVEPGDILVAKNAGPAWTPLFPALGALVLDEGNFTQHAATTAREYGVPAVIGTHDATRRIEDGAWLVVDGTEGTVTIEEAD